MSMMFASPSPMMTLTLPPIHTCLDDEFDADIPLPDHELSSPHLRQQRSNIYIPKHRKQPSTPPLQAVIQPQDEIQKMITLVEDGNKDGVLSLLAYHRSTTSSLLDLSHQYNQRQTHHPSPQPLIWTLLDEALCASACRGHVDLVIELLEQPWINLNAYREQDSMTPLFLAAQYHHIYIVSLLIIKGASTDYNRIIKRQKQRRQVMTRFDDNKMATVQHLELQYLASVSTELEELGHDHDDDDSDDEDEEEDEEAWDEEFTSSSRQDRLDVTLPIAIVDIILDYTRVMGTGGYPD